MPRPRFWQADGPRVVSIAGGHEGAIVRAIMEGGFMHAGASFKPHLGERVGHIAQRVASLVGSEPAALADEGWAPDVPDWAETGERTSHGYTLIDNVAFMTVEGALMSRGYSGYWSGCYWPGYRDYIAALEAANRDERVEGILVSFTTPGGFVSGLIEAARAWRGLNASAGGKPIIAHVGELCCSAGMALAAQCDAIYASDGATVGSVGARLIVFDMSGAMERWGEKAHVFKSGELKDMGAWWRAPTDRESGLFQLEIDHSADRFFVEYAAGRGVDVEDVRAHRGWEAQTFTAGDPSPPAEIDPLRDDVGLIDGVMDEEAAFQALRLLVSASAPQVSAGGASSRASQKTELKAAGSTHEEPTMSKLTGRLAALAAKKKAGSLSAEEETELKQASAMLAAMNGDEEEEAADDDDDAEAADDGDDDAEAADDGDDDAEAADDDDPEEEAADEDDDAEASANAVLADKAAKARPALAGQLATKVALGKISKADALDLLAAAPAERSSFRDKASQSTPQGLSPAAPGNGSGKKSEAGAALNAAMKRQASNRS